MDYSNIDISQYDWSDYVKRDYKLAMEFLKREGFKNCDWLTNGFILEVIGGHITVEICDRAMLSMVCSAGELSDVFVFGDAKHQISKLKRMIEASK